MTPRGRGLTLLGLAFILIGASRIDLPLVDAAKSGDRDMLRALLDEGADVNAQTTDGSTALLWASYRDDLESAELLIGAGADVNIANDLGATAIWAASRNGSAAMAEELLAAGADPNAPLLLGETPLVTASRSGNSAVVGMLLEEGADVNARGARGQTPLMFAAGQRHPDVVKVLLEHGAEVDATSDTWNQLMAQAPHAHPEHQAWVLHGGNTALMFAARIGDLESARHLVAAGADLDAPSAWGLTPLAVATYADFGDQFLIREQTTRQLVYFDRDRILAGQFSELVEFLLEEGADPNAGSHRFTPLIAAVLHQNEEAVDLFLARAADPNVPLGDFTPHQRGSTTDFYLNKAWVGATPLWLAARYSTPAIVHKLLLHGADPLFVHHSVYYGGGRGGVLAPRQEEITTTLMAAVQMGTGRAWTVLEHDEAMVLESVQLLVAAGVDLNAVGSSQNRGVRGASTALEAAIALGYFAVAEFLVEEGADEATEESAEAPTADATENQMSDGNYRMVEDWITGPEDIGGVSGVTTDGEGNIYAFRRDANNVWNLDPTGRLVKEWGQDIAMWTHAIRVDREGYIWTVDGQAHQIKKWSPDASELLMTLGEYDVAGDGPNAFNRPTDVAVAPNGDFFVSDGYVNTRVAKFDRSGAFITDWGGSGTGPGQFDTVHSITIDSRNRVLVADRENARVQVFDLEGNFLDQWTHLGSPYALFLTEDDRLFVADGVNAKVWIADASDGTLLDTIEGTEGIHWVAVDPSGNVYAASNRSHYLRKYSRVGATN